jgi:hypothetical protein
MKLIGNKVMCNLLAINIIYIVIGYFGILDTTGYLGVHNYYDGIVNGTPSEYWKVTLSYYYSITYLMLPILNIITILLYKGSSDVTKKIALSLKIQIISFILINIVFNILKVKTETYYTEYNLELIPVIKEGFFRYYDFFILILSVLFVMRKDIKNIKIVSVVLLTSLIVLGLTNFHSNIHRAEMINRVIDAQSHYIPDGNPLIKLKPNVFNIEIIPDGFTSFERSTKNYKSLMYMVVYMGTNTPSNKEIFELTDKIYSNYKPQDDTYIKSKLGELYTATMLDRYNQIIKFKENDLYLLDIYKRKGLDEARIELQNLDENRKRSLINMFIHIVKSKKEDNQDMDKSSSNENNKQ